MELDWGPRQQLFCSKDSYTEGFLGGSVVMNPPASAGHMGYPWSGKIQLAFTKSVCHNY